MADNPMMVPGGTPVAGIPGAANTAGGPTLATGSAMMRACDAGLVSVATIIRAVEGYRSAPYSPPSGPIPADVSILPVARLVVNGTEYRNATLHFAHDKPSLVVTSSGQVFKFNDGDWVVRAHYSAGTVGGVSHITADLQPPVTGALPQGWGPSPAKRAFDAALANATPVSPFLGDFKTEQSPDYVPPPVSGVPARSARVVRYDDE